MSEEQEEKPKVPVKMEPAETKLTLARKNDLTKMLKSLEKVTPEAIKVMTEIIQDPTSDPKVRADMVKTALDMRLKISQEISKDQLTRTLGEHKMRMGEKMLAAPKVKTVSEDDDEEDNTVQARFEPNCILRVDTNTL